MILPAKNSPIGDDNDLLVAVANGNSPALEALYLKYHRRLARFVSRVTPRYEIIEEIINDTFMTVWESAKEFRKASQVSTWILGIAYRTALNSLRRQKNHSDVRSLDIDSSEAPARAGRYSRSLMRAWNIRDLTVPTSPQGLPTMTDRIRRADGPSTARAHFHRVLLEPFRS